MDTVDPATIYDGKLRVLTSNGPIARIPSRGSTSSSPTADTTPVGIDAATQTDSINILDLGEYPMMGRVLYASKARWRATGEGAETEVFVDALLTSVVDEVLNGMDTVSTSTTVCETPCPSPISSSSSGGRGSGRSLRGRPRRINSVSLTLASTS